MCKRSYNITKCACRHTIETPGSLIPEDGCNSCGIERGRNDNIASTTSRFPCDDCKDRGLWAQTPDGKWYEVAAGVPQQIAPGFKFPC